MKGLDLAERYFEEIGFPMLQQEFGPYMDRLAAGLVGDGSECFGFDDSVSRDHDWGPGFCLWLSRQDHEEIAESLQVALDGLPKTFEGCGPRRTSEWGDGRVGVFEVSGFYQRFLGLDRIPADFDTWLFLPENSLAACTNGKVFRDPLGEFTEWREALSGLLPGGCEAQEDSGPQHDHRAGGPVQLPPVRAEGRTLRRPVRRDQVLCGRDIRRVSPQSKIHSLLQVDASGRGGPSPPWGMDP